MRAVPAVMWCGLFFAVGPLKSGLRLTEARAFVLALAVEEPLRLRTVRIWPCHVRRSRVPKRPVGQCDGGQARPGRDAGAEGATGSSDRASLRRGSILAGI